MKLHLPNKRSIPLILFAIALLARTVVFAISYWQNSNFIYAFDSAGYIQLGYNLFEYGDFSMSKTAENLYPEFNRTLLYPLLIAGLYFLHLPTEALVVFQMLLSSLSPVLFWYIIKPWRYRTDIKIGSAVLLAVSPTAITLSHLVLTDSLFSFLVLSCFLAVRGEEKYRPVLAGIMASLALLLRPIASFFIILLSFYPLVSRQSRMRFLGIIILPLLIYSSWNFRNYQLTDSTFYSNILPINLLFLNTAYVEAQEAGEAWYSYQEKMMDESRKKYDLRNPEEVAAFNQEAYNLFFQSVTEHPILHLKLLLKNFAYFFIHSPEVSWLPNGPTWLSTALRGFHALVLVFLLLGFLNFLTHEIRYLNPLEKVVLMCLVYFVLASLFTFTSYRFRLPILPFFYLYGLIGFERFSEKFLNKRLEQTTKTTSR